MHEWGFLFSVLDQVHSHSTEISKIWMSVLFLIRITVLGAAAERVWIDEYHHFVCNSQQPGCENVCYDWAFPISHVRFWLMQIIFVSTPTVIYLGRAMHMIYQENKLRALLQSQAENLRLKQPKYTDDTDKIQGKLLVSYTAQLVFKIGLELAFIVGQYYLYGFFMVPMISCSRWPCPHSVHCFMSRPTEKTIINIFMLVVACVSLFLNVIEVFYLLSTRLRCGRFGRQRHHNILEENSASLPGNIGGSLDGAKVKEQLLSDHSEELETDQL